MIDSLMRSIEQALSYVELEHENRQAGDYSLPYSKEMEWVIDTLVDAREVVKRLLEENEELRTALFLGGSDE